MSRLVIRLLEVLSITTAVSAVTTMRPVVIQRTDNDDETCPPQTEREAAIQTVRTTINLIYALENASQYECGNGPWYSVAHLNMSDPSQRCPSAWREFNSGGVRACGRPTTSGGSCPATFYATNSQYSRVCGRAIGYQIGSTDAFSYLAVPRIDAYYAYGVSITHGRPRNHIWTYAAGVSEGDYWQRHNCPCSKPRSWLSDYPPAFVRDNWYCESGNPTGRFEQGRLYSADPLWDGKQCEGECCGNGKSPPWYSVELTNSTTDDIEVRICCAEGTYTDVLIQLLEIYIQ